MIKYIKYLKWKKVIKESGLFDAKYYLFTYPDVRKKGIDPIKHYILFGAKEGRNPSEEFDTKYYLSSNPDVKESGINPLAHYVLYGKKENRVFSHTENHMPFKEIESKNQFHNKNVNKKDSQEYFDFLFSQNNGRDPEYKEFIKHEKVDTGIRLIAFYLPQFHPLKVNDRAWGKGFTEWTNVSKAIPQFEGHYQPHLPGELGFYDLRLKDVQRRQIELAKNYGLYGFCYHYYWFDGKKVMDGPLQQVLDDPDLDFPFCINWANENWTKRWDGLDQDVILKQNHTPEDDIAFLESVKPILTDKRYIRVNGKALLMVYRPQLFPDIRATVKRWREHARKIGIGELYLVLSHSFDNTDPRKIGFDAATEFAPNNMPSKRIRNKKIYNAKYTGTILDYDYLIKQSYKFKAPEYVKFRCVVPSWDNEARKPGKGVSFINSSPEKFSKWISEIIDYTEENLTNDEKIIFVNAWNEWAEGAHLEPDRKYGYAYLEAIFDALNKRKHSCTYYNEVKRIIFVSHDAHFHGAQMLGLAIVKTLRKKFGFDIVTLMMGEGELINEFKKFSNVIELHKLSDNESDEAIKKLYREGYKKAICNTSVVGSTVKLLKDNGFFVISLIHELPSLIKEYKLNDSIEKISHHADKIIFPAKYVKGNFLELVRVAERKIEVIPQGIYNKNKYIENKSRARMLLHKKYNIDNESFVFLNIAYGDRRKGMDLFFETALKILKSRKDAYFIWVGHYQNNIVKPYIEEIKKSGLLKHFILTGKQIDIDMFYSGSDALLFPSREDPFPAVVLDALNAGLPILSFDQTGGFCELIKKHDCGILNKKYNTHILAASAISIMEDKNKYDYLSSNAYKATKEDFNFIKYIFNLLENLQIYYPKVSVIIPNYNYESYIEERLESILNQTFTPYEIIFLDDKSTDNSVQIAVNVLSKYDIPYIIIENKLNRGCYNQWINGIKAASGDIIWIAEADDVADKRFLEKMVGYFNDPKVNMAFCQSEIIDENSKRTGQNYINYTNAVSKTKWLNEYINEGNSEVCDALIIQNTIPNASGVLIRKNAFEGIDEQLAKYKMTGDWFAYIYALKNGSIAFCPEVLNFHRRHSGSIIHSKVSSIHYIIELLDTIIYAKRNFNLDKDKLILSLKNVSNIYRSYCEDRKAWGDFYEHPELKKYVDQILDK